MGEQRSAIAQRINRLDGARPAYFLPPKGFEARFGAAVGDGEIRDGDCSPCLAHGLAQSVIVG